MFAQDFWCELNFFYEFFNCLIKLILGSVNVCVQVNQNLAHIMDLAIQFLGLNFNFF